MPTLYRLDVSAHEAASTFQTDARQDPWSGGHIGAGQFAPIITAGRESVAGPRPQGKLPRRMVPRLWGVPPPPSVTDSPRHGILSVRNLESPFWIGNLRNSEFRCLIPATSFMEWTRPSPTDGKRAQAWVSCHDQPVFAMAGIWKDSEVPSFALLTTPANAALRAEGRETMPVILPSDPAAHALWLMGGWDKAASLIAPYSSSLLNIRYLR